MGNAYLIMIAVIVLTTWANWDSARPADAIVGGLSILMASIFALRIAYLEGKRHPIAKKSIDDKINDIK